MASVSDTLRALISGLVAFALALALAPLVLAAAKKLKARQTVLHYVEQHAGKSGTPTMGGWIFILAASASTLIFGMQRPAVVAVGIALAYGVVGFLDDFIKVHFKQNEGLKPYQKITAQLGISAIAAAFTLLNPSVGTSIHLPFSGIYLNLSYGIIPFTMFVYVALTNAVNLTDGLDGLAGWTSFVFFAVFAAVILSLQQSAEASGELERAQGLAALAVYCLSFGGAVLGFLCLNTYPAKIIMGDTGALALGGAMASAAVFSREPLLILLACIMPIVSCISVILQVAYYKLTKKRIFLMAPFHHHLEKKGWHESKITAVYVVISIIAGVLTLIAAGVK
ncbi:MAG: phospho-N-acetylmuramoyl-pentapeptide-transferase [Christensenellales bacterium]|nr:phospho-N-acetylmuramoyl-pentapeptide-transferase [Eubacteriales bacterium]